MSCLLKFYTPFIFNTLSRGMKLMNRRLHGMLVPIIMLTLFTPVYMASAQDAMQDTNTAQDAGQNTNTQAAADNTKTSGNSDDDTGAASNLGTLAGMYIANAQAACKLSDKETEQLIVRQKKHEESSYGTLEPHFDDNFQKAFNDSYNSARQSIQNGVKPDGSMCDKLNGN